MRLDVLLPFYGDVGYLKQAVRSVVEQTDPEWRLVVIDDCYPDPSVSSWFDDLRDSRVVYLRNGSNLGANANYRHALTMATADYVVVMGADDLMLPDYVQVVRDLTTRFPQAAVIQPGVEVIDRDGVEVLPLVDRVKRWSVPRGRREMVIDGERLAASLLRANWTYFPALCWNRSRIQSIGFREGLNVVQDLALLLDVAAAGGQMVLTDQVTFQYRRHASSDSSQRAAAGDRFCEEARFFHVAAAEFDARGWDAAARAARLRLTSRLHAASLVPTALMSGQLGRAAELCRHATGR